MHTATIGFDARATEPGFKAHFGRGTGRYATELLRHLLELEDSELVIEPLFGAELGARGWERRLVCSLPFGRQTAETQLFLPRRLAQLPVDMLHFMAHGDATARCKKPYLVTVLDLIPLRFPELYQAKKSNWRFRFARKLEEQAIANASGILAISEATKRDVVELLGVDPGRIIVTPLGVRADYQPRSADFAAREGAAVVVRERYGLPADRPIVLYVGGIDPRKNVIFMLRVFAEFLQERSSSGPAEEQRAASRPLLMMVGGYEADDQYPVLLNERSRLGLVGDVILPGYVSDGQILDIYRAAHVKLFPSLYEGFGLPVLEAMALGVPVIAGRSSSIPEVAGDAAVLLELGDCASWVRELKALLASPERQHELIRRGARQAARFTWQRTAELTKDAYRHFLRPLSATSR